MANLKEQARTSNAN